MIERCLSSAGRAPNQGTCCLSSLTLRGEEGRAGLASCLSVAVIQLCPWNTKEPETTAKPLCVTVCQYSFIHNHRRQRGWGEPVGRMAFVCLLQYC